MVSLRDKRADKQSKKRWNASERHGKAILGSPPEDIGKYGLSTDTLRYYEHIGLIPPPPRNAK